jgi:transcriptional regulator with XRE-family HTH domain
LDEAARHAGVSRSTLSRLERTEISPTTTQLSKLCIAYGKTASQLLAEAEPEPPDLILANRQMVWCDETSGFTRRSVSPPHPGLRGELVECRLQPGSNISYEQSPIPGLEHHIWVLAGTLEVNVDSTAHMLGPGDCTRFRLHGASRFRCASTEAVRYALVVVLP